MDNVFMQHLWRSLKCEAVHLHELTNGIDAHWVITSWMAFYNDCRPYAEDGL